MIAVADFVDVLAGGKVHHGVGAVVNGVVQLVELAIEAAGDGRVADVGVDFALGGDADAHRLEPLGKVHRVGGDDQSAGGHFARISSASSSSRLATNSISRVVWPARACSS